DDQVDRDLFGPVDRKRRCDTAGEGAVQKGPEREHDEQADGACFDSPPISPERAACNGGRHCSSASRASTRATKSASIRPCWTSMACSASRLERMRCCSSGDGE